MIAAVSSMAATYDVGDDSGWTIMGGVNYNEWASSKTFHAGDTLRKFLLFSFSTMNHVLQQLHSPPKRQGTTLFQSWGMMITSISSVVSPGHCEMGQKVDIQVAAQIPAISPPSATPPPPSKSSASYLLSSSLLVGLVGAATYLISMH
ncbi:hypothetical protein MKW92_000461 [Papaver armeniacum]|nr:hypothetical protein MKW92_000461 [Papaver armeniacum]